jgi:23S rRNA (pseudouridine1915-N3)-methyltransferase
MKSGPERDLCARYLDRAIASGRNLGLTGFTIAETTESRASGDVTRRAEEARALRENLSGSVLIALDERGKSISSRDLADRIALWRDNGAQNLDLMIGGADGLDPALRDEADLVLSFSRLTWPHQLVRIMMAEQLYRVTTILAGHPYHRA